MKSIAFIGTGNMGGAMAKACAKVLDPSEIIITNRTRAKAEEIAEEIHCTVVNTNVEAVKSATYIVLGVKPQMMEAVLKEIADTVKSERKKRELVILTIAAGKAISFYQSILGDIPIIRLMPNTPCLVSEGMTLLVRSPKATDEHVEKVKNFFSKSGLIQEIPESQMDAAGSVAGCGTGFVCMFIEALADGAVMAGIPRPDAYKYAAQALKGTAELVLQSGKHPDALKDEICSPGGSTIAGVKALEDGKFRATVMEAVLQSTKRNQELGK
ncbi:pyrroline-5-carboxylate reductase family protein [Trichomonas vaginalis G3]|uniref:Pyrroline-5-carboxylate reductase n=1 Tax=Trichomonas vaginalis (strain ATCC PRA-98 / G3) TaxID=412133 RepID=A2DTK2_TRIV3|nr:pyrroline-5-carboxylate reductase protein [Trichomonas vaginalis G3]EAY16311.1 pyrroline-5-carboxylate reductase family protein [Trichomonas vaginalis G3]KAI5523471.1 pyrroline-5-carboxylate reductase protein [Trichomonas vaginalis G3]|eukprot:XP_001328534.1 pyrroline-5-carboxylate reductase family protein [Trichomonas vaginalis G3]